VTVNKSLNRPMQNGRSRRLILTFRHKCSRA